MPRGPLLFAIFVAVPLVEMYILIRVGGYLGALPTVGLVMLTAVIGVTLLRRQGLATLTRAQTNMNVGVLPAKEMAEGIMLAVAGALLLTPGFFTDAVGFSLLVPAVRSALLSRVTIAGQPQSQGDVIEGEVISREDEKRG